MGGGSVKMTPLKVDIKNQVLENIKKAAQSTENDIRTKSLDETVFTKKVGHTTS